MSDLQKLQKETSSLLKEGGPDAAFGVSDKKAEGRRFSIFNDEDADRAQQLAESFTRIADSISGDAGLEAVLAEMSTLLLTESPDLVRHAMMLFMTHSEKGRKLKIPDLEERAPNKILPSPRPALGALVSPETQMDWFREDAKANEHHEHWHFVYPKRGLVNTHPPRLNDRHGELFFYMHQQMLARYDTERIAAGLARTAPLADYKARIAEGYDPGPGLTTFPGPHSQRVFAARKPNAILKDQVTIDAQLKVEKLFETAISSGKFVNGKPVNSDSLGEYAEATFKTLPEYGNHHGNGHVLIAYVEAKNNDDPPGVMSDPATAIRDPVFWRWHRHVDDFNFKWQERQPPNDFSDAPPVLIRKTLDGSGVENASSDIILAFKDQMVDANGSPVEGDVFGERQFGGGNWDTDFSGGEWSTDTLLTKMETRDIALPNGTKVPVQYLDQKEFGYFIRAENQANVETEVTVRIFLVAERLADDRRMWIEMDKFHRKLGPNQKAVLFQPAEMSSVIKKPGIKPPGSKIEDPNIPHTPEDDTENYCTCGWPYNLLLPRGSAGGMKFRLLVMLTDWNKDLVKQSECGSMSFCGARDLYPDRRAMGYPFDRPFPGNAITPMIVNGKNVATRDFIIKNIL